MFHMSVYEPILLKYVFITQKEPLQGFIYVYGWLPVQKPGTCECPLFLGLNSPNQGPLQSKQVIWVTGLY